MFHGIDSDNLVICFLSKTADLLILNVIFIICCFPVITIGDSLTALYSVTLKMVKNEEGAIVSEFFYAFKRNFRLSTVLWMLVLAVDTAFWLIYCSLSTAVFLYKSVLYIVFAVLVILFLFMAIYLFPYIARFENTWINTLKNAFLVSLMRLPYTILLFFILLAAVMITCNVDIRITGLVWILVGFSGIAYSNSFLLRRAFQKLEDGL